MASWILASALAPWIHWHSILTNGWMENKCIWGAPSGINKLPNWFQNLWKRWMFSQEMDYLTFPVSTINFHSYHWRFFIFISIDNFFYFSWHKFFFILLYSFIIFQGLTCIWKLVFKYSCAPNFTVVPHFKCHFSYWVHKIGCKILFQF